MERKPTTIVRVCSCRHDFQDQTYGKWMRVFNYAPAKDKAKDRWRCTVCGNYISYSR